MHTRKPGTALAALAAVAALSTTGVASAAVSGGTGDTPTVNPPTDTSDGGTTSGETTGGDMTGGETTGGETTGGTTGENPSTTTPENPQTGEQPCKGQENPDTAEQPCKGQENPRENPDTAESAKKALATAAIVRPQLVDNGMGGSPDACNAFGGALSTIAEAGKAAADAGGGAAQDRLLGVVDDVAMGGQAMGCGFAAVDPATGSPAAVTPDAVARTNTGGYQRSGEAKKKLFNDQLCGDLQIIYSGEQSNFAVGVMTHDTQKINDAKQAQEQAKSDAKKGGCSWAQ